MLYTSRRQGIQPKTGQASWLYPVLRAVAAVIACIGLHGIKVQQGVATHQPLQLCGTEQVNGWAPTQCHEPLCEGLKLQSRHVEAINHRA